MLGRFTAHVKLFLDRLVPLNDKFPDYIPLIYISPNSLLRLLFGFFYVVSKHFNNIAGKTSMIFIRKLFNFLVDIFWEIHVNSNRASCLIFFHIKKISQKKMCVNKVYFIHHFSLNQCMSKINKKC